MTFSPGQLVKYRDRDWVVQPNAPEHKDVLLLKPLGGSDHETVGIYTQLQSHYQLVASTDFAPPSLEQLGSFEHARLLYDANRLIFRQASGPLRAIARLSFRPRAYQLVPMVMALKQLAQRPALRLLIADDVGVGKTIEALMIMAELLERRMAANIAVVCPPHLCDQWQAEIKEKLGREAVIIRSSTVSSLERQVPNDANIWTYFPIKVISIDYIKADQRLNTLVHHAPDLVIADEVHTAARPSGASHVSAQLRHRLLLNLAKLENTHLVMLTATPHSGKDDEFKSLLALLDPTFANLDLSLPADRRRLAPHFVQRKRTDLRNWLQDSTNFPTRVHTEVPYKLAGTPFLDFYQQLLAYVRMLSTDTSGTKAQQNMRHWAALALLRGAMSSPEAGLQMLRKRTEVPTPEVTEAKIAEVDVAEDWFAPHTDNTDLEETDLVAIGLTRSPAQDQKLTELIALAEALKAPGQDPKVARLIERVRKLLAEGAAPIIFCKYIKTAEYVGEKLRSALGTTTTVAVVTSELADEQRREEINKLRPTEATPRSQKYVLVATDCLSEGINLQDLFSAVIHYDLPWNPNRLEQREGRIDRFGQNAPQVYIDTLFGQDNRVDQTVLEVIIRKIREIQASLGTSIPLAEGKGSVLDKLFSEIVLREDPVQLSLFEQQMSQSIDESAEKANNIRRIFSQSNLNPDDLKHDLDEIDQAIGTPETVANLLTQGLPLLGFQNLAPLQNHPHTFRVPVVGQNAAFPALAQALLAATNNGKQSRITVNSPTPAGTAYIGRNHALTETLCQTLLNLALNPAIGQSEGARLSRAAVVATPAVTTPTTLVMARVRNVIRSKKSRDRHELVAEEMYLWGYSRTPYYAELDATAAHRLLLETTEHKPLPEGRATRLFTQELEFLQKEESQQRLEQLAIERCHHLAASHQKFGKAVGEEYEAALTPVIPPEIIGLYVLVPVLAYTP